MKNPLPDQSFLLELLRYDEESGELCWKRRIGQRTRIGEIAGTIRPTGYRFIAIGGTLFAAHRLIWKMLHGTDPVAEIDHVDGVRSNNVQRNLREANKTENCRNKRGWGKVSKGTRITASGKWNAQIQINGKKKYLGSFDTEAQASAAYAAAALEHFGEFARAA